MPHAKRPYRKCNAGWTKSTHGEEPIHVYKNLQEYAGPTAPKIERHPMLSGGTVSMHTTQSALLVSGRFSEAPASLVSGSTAVFNLDLTENGAAFMHELFVGSGGSGRVDLTPVQVIYNLKMWARLPPVKITVVGDSERIQSTLQKISQTTRDNVCTPAEIETFRESGTNSAMLKETGMVTVTIDKGDATVPEEALQALEQSRARSVRHDGQGAFPGRSEARRRPDWPSIPAIRS